MAVLFAQGAGSAGSDVGKDEGALDFVGDALQVPVAPAAGQRQPRPIMVSERLFDLSVCLLGRTHAGVMA